jgi:hypothetical protein
VVVDPGRAVRALVIITLAVACVSMTTISYSEWSGRSRLLGLVRLFDIGNESNIPTWWSSTLLLACSALLAVIAKARGRRRSGVSLDWWALSAIFLILAIDEVAMIHEVLGGAVFGPMILRALGIADKFPTVPWIVPYVPLLLLFAAYFARFFLRLPRRTRIGFAGSAGLFVGGGVGVEAVAHAIVRQGPEYRTAHVALTVLEEFMEMAGVLMFIWVLIDYMKETLGGATISVQVG